MTRNLLPLMGLICAPAFAQNDSVRVVTTTRIISMAEVPKADVFDNEILLEPAVFKGGQEALDAYWKENLKLPAGPAPAIANGAVQVQFVVETDGMVNEVVVVKGVDPLLDKEAMRVVLAMPNWKPALVKELPVRARVLLPVRFTVE